MATRTIDPGFGDRPVTVHESTILTAVPHINSNLRPGSKAAIADTEVHVTAYQFEHAGMVVKRGPNGKPFDLKVQASDQYGYQREFSVAYQREPGTSSFRWVVSTYQHPFHRPDQDQVVTAGKARRFIDRLVELAESYPSLVFNNSGYTAHTPPHFRARHEGFVRWHTALLNGAEFSVTLLD